jgi:crotonobetainyl-CoA:carnitine CoA-transferase CaiB-like acyl-CoA transferase
VTQDLMTATGRLAVRDELDQFLAEWMAERTAAVAVTALRAHGLPAAVAIEFTEIVDEPQLVDRQYFVTLDHPEGGVRRYPGWPMQFSFAACQHRSGPPTPGQHTSAVLGELDVVVAELSARP